jgi:hypothetical protein
LKSALKFGRQLGVALATAVVIGRIAEAGQLRKVWELNAREFARNETEASVAALGMFALSFSPDGHRIAAVVGRSWREEFILILDVADPHGKTRRLDVNPKIWESDPTSYSSPSWSSSGGQILLGHTIVQVPSGNACSLPEGAMFPGFFFIGDAQVAGKEWNPTRLSFYDLDCHHTGIWVPANDWDIYDTFAEQSLICIRQDTHDGGGTKRQVLVIDSASKKMVKQLPWPSLVRFADRGKAICGVGGTPWHLTVGCLNLDTGKELGTTKGWTALDLRTASRAPRVVLSEYGRKLDWFVDWFWYVGSLKKRVVWDFRTGKELVTWHPKSQTVFLGDFPNAVVGRPQPLRFAISPDGEYVVEGGAGVVTLYTIEP